MIKLDKACDDGKTMLNIYYARLRDGAQLDETDIYDILKNYEHCLESLAYLSSCNAATLETAPKSMPKSQRARFVTINKKAVDMLREQYFGEPKHSNAYADKIHGSYARCFDLLEPSQPGTTQDVDCEETDTPALSM